MLERTHHAFLGLIVAFLSLVVSGCSVLGQSMVKQDREGYSSALVRGEAAQLLLNIVRLRYLELPVFLQVSGITDQKTFSPSVAADIKFYNIYRVGAPGSSLSPYLEYKDSPTISFTPLQGSDFAQKLLTPLSLESIFYVCHSNWDIRKVFLLAMQNIGPYNNKKGYVTMQSGSSPWGYRSFLRAVRYLQTLQQEDAIQFFKATSSIKEERMVIVFHDHAELELAKKLKKLLHVPPESKYIMFTSEYKASHQPNMVLLKTRSLVAIMSYLSNMVQVPERHIRLHQANPVKLDSKEMSLFKIYSSLTPVKAMHSVYFNGYYFYIKDDDLQSKHVFLLLNHFYQLKATVASANTGTILSLPVG